MSASTIVSIEVRNGVFVLSLCARVLHIVRKLTLNRIDLVLGHSQKPIFQKCRPHCVQMNTSWRDSFCTFLLACYKPQRNISSHIQVSIFSPANL